jgi:hypothetical protein
MLKDELYKPPLLLTATNLSKKKLELISSVDIRYANVPIAKAVRASAGFPVFFTPTEMPECPEGGGWYVDGGLVSNFPIWTLSDAFRNAIERSHLEEKYRTIAFRPWVRIGLRVVDDVAAPPDLKDAALFFESIWSMLSGGTRNELEEILAADTPRNTVIRQTYSEIDGRPSHFLDVGSLTPTVIESMVASGYAFAQKKLAEVKQPDAIAWTEHVEQAVTKQLRDLVESCQSIFARWGDCRFRANVFLPVWADYEPRMRLIYGYNMGGDPDADMEFPDLESGLTGFCYVHRHPQVCNLQKIGELRKRDPERYGRMFGMDKDLQIKVKTDRTWLASVPIFDPKELKLGRSTRELKQRYKGHFYSNVEAEFEGPVLGVLNIDAGWDYGAVELQPDPDTFVFDSRVRTVLAIMQTTSFGIADALCGDRP